mgnify:CR=1 FL=1|tara:strand:+ start:896 stop:2071 length:1176 start_codon:yes stop_codon:yes gene_type:complete
MKNVSSRLFGLAVLIISLSSCEGYLGDKTDLSFIELPQQNFREVAYVPVQPILNQFASPTDVIAGFDELIYVVDNGSQEVIALDQSGREVGRRFIQGAKTMAQDRQLDLLVIGSITDSNNITRSCIYRLDLSTSLGYGLRFAVFTDTITHPFYFKSSSISSDQDVSLNNIAVLSDNSFYVTRTGPRTTPTRDDAILFFDNTGKFITPLEITDSRGAVFPDFFKDPVGITSLVKPPQIGVDNRGDFIFTSVDPNGVLKVQYIEKLESVDGIAYTPKTNFSADTTLASSFINDPFKFDRPVDVEFTGDGTNYIFVIDAEKDSLYQFTANGLEGVEPPAASGETKFIKTSFGGTGIGASKFNGPTAVAYNNKVLYIADTGNGRLLRFKLTLDIR